MTFRQNSSKFGMSAVVNECVMLGKGHFEKVGRQLEWQGPWALC